MNVHLFMGLLAWLGTVCFLFDKTRQHGDADFSGMLTTRRTRRQQEWERRTKPGTLWRQDHKSE
jgi:hypothetical protein